MSLETTGPLETNGPLKATAPLEATRAVDHARVQRLRLLRADARWRMFAALVVLNVVDVITTQLVLDRGGSEFNPLVKPMVDGTWQVVLAKGLVLVIIACLLTRSRSRITEIALALTTGWYLAVVAWNLVVLALL